MNYLSIAEAAKELGIDELDVIRKIRSGNLEAWVNFINTVPGRVVSPECAEYGSDINVRGCWKLGMTGEPLSGGALTIIERAEVRLRHGIQMENPKNMLGYIFISQNKKICALLDSKKLKSPEYEENIFAGELPDDAILAVSFDDVEQLKALDATRDAPSKTGPLAPAPVVNVCEVPRQNRGTLPVLTEDDKTKIVRLYDRTRGNSVNALSKQFNVSRPTIDNVLKRAGVKVSTQAKKR